MPSIPFVTRSFYSLKQRLLIAAIRGRDWAKMHDSVNTLSGITWVAETAAPTWSRYVLDSTRFNDRETRPSKHMNWVNATIFSNPPWLISGSQGFDKKQNQCRTNREPWLSDVPTSTLCFQLRNRVEQNYQDSKVNHPVRHVIWGHFSGIWCIVINVISSFKGRNMKWSGTLRS